MASRLAWVLNLDADLELEAGEGYAPSKSVRRAMGAHVETLRRSLLSADDLLVDDHAPSSSARGCIGRAFCPTPRALDRLHRAGATPEAHPPFDVLRRVNGRAFAASLGPTLPGGAFVRELDDAIVRLGEPPPVGEGWRIKRAFGMAGRGQRVVAAGELDPRAQAFLRDAIHEGGAQLEPNVSIDLELAQHGLLAAHGSVRLGALVRQRCDARGAWRATERIDDLVALGDCPALLRAEAQRVARALAAEGYFGPFGIDAFLYRDRAGARRLQPRSEINARYSMGFAIGFGRQPR